MLSVSTRLQRCSETRMLGGVEVCSYFLHAASRGGYNRRVWTRSEWGVTPRSRLTSHAPLHGASRASPACSPRDASRSKVGFEPQA